MSDESESVKMSFGAVRFIENLRTILLILIVIIAVSFGLGMIGGILIGFLIRTGEPLFAYGVAL